MLESWKSLGAFRAREKTYLKITGRGVRKRHWYYPVGKSLYDWLKCISKWSFLPWIKINPPIPCLKSIGLIRKLCWSWGLDRLEKKFSKAHPLLAWSKTIRQLYLEILKNGRVTRVRPNNLHVKLSLVKKFKVTSLVKVCILEIESSI